jgi:hypothetical protein
MTWCLINHKDMFIFIFSDLFLFILGTKHCVLNVRTFSLPKAAGKVSAEWTLTRQEAVETDPFVLYRIPLHLCHTSSVTSASHSDSVVVQSYQCSLFFTTFCNFKNRISKIISPTMKSKANVKIGVVNQRIANRRFMEPSNVD